MKNPAPKLPFTEEERAAMVAAAHITAVPDYEGFWKELQDRMDDRDKAEPLVTPRNLAHH